jgi:alpha-amylase/alpha-mannosidase (GH57 family)
MRRIVAALVCLALFAGAAFAESAPLNLAIVWHQHQPLYWNRLTGEYELPWVRIHAVQEYIDSARISAEFPSVHVTFNLQPSLLWQLEDYATITSDEAAQGGLYDYIGAIDNHLTWIWALANDPSSLSADDRANLQEQCFWLNGYMLDDDGNDPYYDPYYYELQQLSTAGPLTDPQLLDAAGLFLLWQISPELHDELGISDLRGKSGFTLADIERLLDAQMTVIQEVVAAYGTAAALGNELITSPFYHPILPLLAEHGWETDALGQLAEAQAQHERLFGEPAVGVWSPEQAVSEASVALLGEAGFEWTSADEGILAQALGHTPSLDELTSVYSWDDVAILFRETELSNKISFSYGNKETTQAVADFVAELQQIHDGLTDPSAGLLTLAMDGENWMFMAGYPNNGRSFLRALYSELSGLDWIRTVTPAEFLGQDATRIALSSVPTGSWAGDLSTWTGEPDEDQAWDELAAARDEVSSAGDPSSAVEAIYAAEGSDWFWWYGTDQDSGTDDLFDWLFKAHLIGAYQAAGVASSDIPAILSLRLITPTPASLGEATPVLDGATTEQDGWSDAVALSGDGELVSAHVAYRESTLYVTVETSTPPSSRIGDDLYLVLYASGKPGDAANIATRYSGTSLGFPLATAMQISFNKLDANGKGVVSRYAANGRGGWTYASSIGTAADRVVRVGTTIEFSVPFSEVGMEAGKSTTLTLVLERTDELLGLAPEQPILAAVPTLIKGEERFSIADPAGDDHGTGSYVYPLDSVFDTPGLFDLLEYRVYDADDAWQLAFDFAALPNPWNGALGFSHPIIYLYLDVADGGSTVSDEEGAAAQVQFDPDHPWDVFVRIAGWPAYGRHLWTADGKGPELIGVASDPKKGRIIVTLPKSLVPNIEGWHYVLVGSQDGYGSNYLRAIGTTATQWAGGGSPDPFWAPAIYDYLAPTDTTQEEILSTYDASARRYATLVPVHVEFDTP